MSYWNSETLKERIPKLGLITDRDGKGAFDEQRVQHCAYELALGREHLVTASGKPTEVTLTKGGPPLVVPPGQFALLMTEEVVEVPLNALGFISIRASTKFKGLINVSGFHVDPGYKGNLKFSVYNAGASKIPLKRGEVIFMLWLADLNQPTKDGYGGAKEKNFHITSKDHENLDGEVASPSQLLKDIIGLRKEVRIMQATAGALLLAALPFFFERGCSKEKDGEPNRAITVHQHFETPFSNSPTLTTNAKALQTP